MTFKIIHSLQAFSDAIPRTAVHHLTIIVADEMTSSQTIVTNGHMT